MRLLNFERESRCGLDDSHIPEVRAPPCLDRGADRVDPGTGSEVTQICFPALLGQSAVCENWLKV